MISPSSFRYFLHFRASTTVSAGFYDTALGERRYKTAWARFALLPREGSWRWHVVSILLMFAVLQSALRVNHAGAAEPDIWNIPAPTIVFRIEGIPQCKECPSFDLRWYSNGTMHYEGKEAVFRLGEYGDYKHSERQRTANPIAERHPGSAKIARQNYLLDVQLQTRPGTNFIQAMEKIYRSGFFDMPRDETGPPSDTKVRTRMRIEAHWQGRSHSILVADDAVPSNIKPIIWTYLGGEVFLQSAPTFWADDDAVLSVTEYIGRCESTTGLILYKSGKAVLFGWNKLTRKKTFEIVTAPIEKSTLWEIFSGFDLGKTDPDADDVSFSRQIPGGLYRSRFIDKAFYRARPHVIIYKPNPNKLLGVPSAATSRLQEVWDGTRAKLAKGDPAFAAQCQSQRSK